MIATEKQIKMSEAWSLPYWNLKYRWEDNNYNENVIGRPYIEYTVPSTMCTLFYFLPNLFEYHCPHFTNKVTEDQEE